MSPSALRFGAFYLDPADRRLSTGGRTLELNTRYLDALILLVEAAGELVTKDRFMDEVWRGVPVTDEALTQAIRTLRRTLGDSASAPRFIETVPKHGYRFVAAVEVADGSASPVVTVDSTARSRFLHSALRATAGAIVAGAVVGLLYGFVGAAQQQPGGGGAVSLLLVLVLVSIFSAGVAGSGIAIGLAASHFVRPLRVAWMVAGGAVGGLTIGAFANLLGGDAFRLLFGQDIGAFAGAFEGLVLGAAVGLAACVARKGTPRGLAVAALVGAGGGLAIALSGGRMMAGSLQSLVHAFPSSQFSLDGIGRMLGENGFGTIAHASTAAFEGAVFTVAIVWAWSMGERIQRG